MHRLSGIIILQFYADEPKKLQAVKFKETERGIIKIMKLKEKIRPVQASAEKTEETRRLPVPAEIFFSALLGYLSAGTGFGIGGAPLCVSAAAAVSPLKGFAVFAGTMANLFLHEKINASVTEIIAIPAIILSGSLFSAVFGKPLSPFAKGIFAGAAYFICGMIAAFSLKITAALVMALVFRGIVCGAAAFLAGKIISAAEDGTVFSPDNRIALSAVYAILICILCTLSLGTVNVGRTAGAFLVLAAAYRAGSGAGGTAAALTSFAAGAASSALLPSSPILICSGLVSGMLRRNGRLTAALSFLGFGLAGALIYGMPSDTLKLLADMTAAAVIFCALPDRVFRRTAARAAGTNSVSVMQYGERLRFASAAVSDVRESFSKAARVLDRKEQTTDISRRVCGKVCSGCRTSAFCGESEKDRIEKYFRPAEKILDKKGFITEKELHKSLECCPHRAVLAEAFNSSFRKSQSERRFGDASECMREITAEQLESTENMLDFLSLGANLFPSCDEELSGYIKEIISSAGAKNSYAALFSDRLGRVYIECFYEGMLNMKTDELTEKLSLAADRELAPPESVSLGEITRLCFHEPETFEAEIGSAKVNGREETSGDFGTVFRDGFGNLSVMLSDGMGSGARAAVESCMTVSIVARMMRAGLGSEAAVRLINLLLLTKSPEECFSTVDLFTVNMFTGKAELIKLGAAQTFVKSNGTVKTVESWSIPVGIVSSVEINRRNIQLSDGDEVVMITDGICEECFPRVRELMLSMGVTAQDCAERIIAAAENEKEKNLYRQDDKTVYVVKMHKI